MISYNEKELFDIQKNKGLISIDRKKQKQPQTGKMEFNLSSVLNIFFNQIIKLLSELKGSIEKLTLKLNDIDSKISKAKNSIKPEPKQPEQKKSEDWDFDIIRNIDNQITQIKAKRRN